MKNIVLLIISVLVFFASWGGYAFLMTRINTSIDSIATTKVRIDSVGRREGLAKTAEFFIADTESDREELARFVVDDQGVIEVIETIEAAARREKIDASISSVTIQANEGWQSHELVRVAVNGKGKYTALAAFASALETLPFAARLESVSLENISDRTWSGGYTVVLVKEKNP